MGRWKEKLEAWARAITYGEAGDGPSAMEFLKEIRHRPQSDQSTRRKRRQDRPRARIYRS